MGTNSVWVESGVNDTSDRYIKLDSGETPATIRVGKHYIELRDNTAQDNQVIRLYICRHNPGNTGIPVGSIGIGW